MKGQGRSSSLLSYLPLLLLVLVLGQLIVCESRDLDDDDVTKHSSSVAGDDNTLIWAEALASFGSKTSEIIRTFSAALDLDIWPSQSRADYAAEVNSLVGDDVMEFSEEDGEFRLENPELLDNQTCVECVALIGLLENLIQEGADYEDLKNVTMQICYLFVPTEGWNPDTLCELALDTYAPHVVYILNTTDKNPRQICQFFDICPVSDWSNLLRGYTQIVKKNNHEKRKSDDAGKNPTRKNPIRLLHITDLHTDPEYSVGSPVYCDMPLCCRVDSNGNGSAMTWGDYKCNTPLYTVDHIFTEVLYQLQPDIIVYTGDTIQHTVWDQPQDETLALNSWLAARLWHYFPGIPTYYSLGNHDMAPTNLYYNPRPEIAELNSEMFEAWKLLSKIDGVTEAEQTFNAGFYYTATPLPGLRVLSYNTNYASLENFYALLLYDEPDYWTMLQWMEDTLSAADANGEKVIMLGHHPTGGSNRIPGYDEFVTDLHARYGDTVILHLLGHNHNDKFAIVRDATDAPRGVMISSPAMTSYTDVNPSVRLIHLDPDTYTPLDHVTYRTDLALDGNGSSPPMRLSYNTATDYLMPDLTASSFDEFVNRLENDPDLMTQFRYNMETLTGTEGECDSYCEGRLICDLRHADHAGRSQCRDQVPPPPPEEESV